MNSFQRGMAKATELTRSGRLQEATDLIRSLVHPGPVAPKVAVSEEDVIEGDYTRVMPDRAPLSETLRKIAAGGMPAPDRAPGRAPDAAKGAQFLTLTHKDIHGARSYRLYVPAARHERMPLVVMLHGCTQTAEDFAAGTGMNALAEVFGCLIAYPTQPSGAHMQNCWNWYRPEDQSRDRGEPALIAGIARDIQRDHGADPSRTYVAGLSAGGAAAAVVAAAYPDVFAAVGVHSGLPVGSARDVVSAFGAMRSGAKGRNLTAPLPVIVFHGSADATVHPANGPAVLAQSLAAMPGLKAKVTKGRVPKGHAFKTTTHLDANGRPMAALWEIEGAGHAWAGGAPAGSYTDAKGPSASDEMLRFFLQHQKA